MQTNPSPERPSPLLILGRIQNSADLALRRILHTKASDQPIVVLDYQGHLSTNLTERNKGNLQKGPLLWCDLANRRKPIAMFRFTRTAGMNVALRIFLGHCVRALTASVSAPTMDAAVDLAYRLADHGSVGLLALLTGLRRPEMAQLLRGSPTLSVEVDQLISVLDWMLRFPAVWAMSEGNNPVELGHQLKAGGTIWIELGGAYLELWEHQFVSWMLEAALTDALLSLPAGPARSSPRPLSPIVLYGFPTSCPLPLCCVHDGVKHVGLFAFSTMHPLHKAARTWVEMDADIWIVGAVGELEKSRHTDWLTDTERLRLQSLEPGQVWVRAGTNHKAVTTLVRPPEKQDLLPRAIRYLATKKLTRSPVKQFSTAGLALVEHAPQNVDLFKRLCTTESLYAGWFRAKGRNSQSQGCDRITIEQFGATLDIELRVLAAELSEGRYRCRPLRTVRIPKPDGEFRVLKVACVRDRVVQAACLHLMEPLFDTRFSAASFAYRPGRGAHHAVAMARSAIRSGKHWAVVADIKKCFDTIDHEIVLRLVGDVIGDRDLIQLIRNWLVAEVIDFMDLMPSEVGVPQGESISPLLANIYLDPLDKEFEREGITFVRYADDYVIFCETEAQAQAALRLMGDFLQGVLRLSLKPTKTSCQPVTQGVGFLGFEIGLNDVQIPQAKLALTVRKMAELVEVMSAVQSSAMERYEALMGVNAKVRGFRNYFLIDNAATLVTQLEQLDIAVDALADDKLRDVAGMDAAWASRERFAPQLEDVTKQLQTAATVAFLTGAYPQDRPQYPTYAKVGIADAVTSPIALGGTEPVANIGKGVDVLVSDGRLHVMTAGCYVTVSGDDVVVKRHKAEVFRVPIVDISLLYLEGKGIALSAELTMRLCDADIPVVFTALIGAPVAIAQSVKSTRSAVRQQQAMRRSDPDILKAGFRMLAAKVANQASVLKYFARYRKRTEDDLYVELTRNADEIRTISETLEEFDAGAVNARASVMGLEGRAAAKYWAAFSRLLPDGVGFPGRHTRNATDRVNSAINYVYGVLYGEVWRAVVRAGLDPYFGIIHGTERDQGSLVFDLIEEYRAPFGDRVVLGLLGRGFDIQLDKQGLLHAMCRRKLVLAFHKQWHKNLNWRGKLREPMDILNAQMTSLKNAFGGKEEYRPFRFRW